MPTRHILMQNLRREIERQQKAVGDVATKAGVPVVELYEALAGNLSPTVDWLERVARALGTSASELVRPR